MREEGDAGRGWAQPPGRSELQPRGSAAPDGAGWAGRCPRLSGSSLLLLRLFILFCFTPPLHPPTSPTPPLIFAPGRGEDELAAADSPQAGWVLVPSFISLFLFFFFFSACFGVVGCRLRAGAA